MDQTRFLRGFNPSPKPFISQVRRPVPTTAFRPRVGPPVYRRKVGYVLAHNRARISQRSGKSGWPKVERKYAAPADPPVPVFTPIVRSTIFTWR